MYYCLTKQASPTLINNFCFLKIYLPILSFIDWQRISAIMLPNPPELFPPIPNPQPHPHKGLQAASTSSVHKQRPQTKPKPISSDSKAQINRQRQLCGLLGSSKKTTATRLE